MKRIVAAGYGVKDIMTSDDGMFILKEETGTGRNDTQYTRLRVDSTGMADDFVVQVRLYSTNGDFDAGVPFSYQYYTDKTEVAHGMRRSMETLDDTEDYIYVLECALKFARKVNQYIRQHKEWDANYKVAKG